MEIKLDSEAVKEVFEQYANPALKSKIRETVKKELKNILEDEIKNKINSVLTFDRIEKLTRESLKELFANKWVHEKKYPITIMEKIVLDEFDSKVKNVDFNKLDALVLKECRAQIEEKMHGYQKIIKIINKQI